MKKEMMWLRKAEACLPTLQFRPNFTSTPPAIPPAGSKPQPSGEAVKKEMMRLRKAEAELGARVRELEGDLKAARAARAALEAQLEETQAAGKVRQIPVDYHNNFLSWGVPGGICEMVF